MLFLRSHQTFSNIFTKNSSFRLIDKYTVEFIITNLNKIAIINGVIAK
jgi:hypothetical protein